MHGGNEPPVLGPERGGDEFGLVHSPGALLQTVDLLQADDVGCQIAGCRGESCRLDRPVTDRPPVQQVERRQAQRGHLAGSASTVSRASRTMSLNVVCRSSAEVSSWVTRWSETVRTVSARTPNWAAMV